MRKHTLITFVLSLAFLAGCGESKDEIYFNGDIQYWEEDDAITKNIPSKQLVLDGEYAGTIAVHDLLLICWDNRFPGHFFEVYNIDKGVKVGSFVPKGKGPGEMSSVNIIFQLYKKGTDLMTLLRPTNEGKLYEWNITQSVRKQATVYDTIVPYSTDRGLFLFYQNEDNLLTYTSSDLLEEYGASTPFYEKRSIFADKLIQEYPIYKMKTMTNNESPKYSFDSFFYTWDTMKPDGTKIVQVMRRLPQINIIDTRTGKVTGCRMEGASDFSFLEGQEVTKEYYRTVQADDNYIYATYWGKENWIDRPGIPIPIFNTIHVFDWNGKLVYKLITDQSYFRTWLDTARNRLYTLDMNTDEIHYIDLQEVFKE